VVQEKDMPPFLHPPHRTFRNRQISVPQTSKAGMGQVQASPCHKAIRRGIVIPARPG